MTFIAESLDSFLNEDLGNLQPFKDIPEEWKNRLLKTGYMGGRNSEVIELPANIDYKILLKHLKNENFLMCFIKIDGKTEYMIEPVSTNKFKLKQAKWEYSVKKKRKEEEDRRRDEVNEGYRRPRYHDPAEIGELSVPAIQKWLVGLKEQYDDVRFFVILNDIDRKNKVLNRSNLRGSNMDPLKKSPWSSSEITGSQANRYSIYTEKKRAQLDKEFDKVLEKMKQQVIDNFDKSMEKVIEDMRKGYSWGVNTDSIGKAILKGVDLSEFKKFVEAYDAIEPNAQGNPIEASKKIKKLGF